MGDRSKIEWTDATWGPVTGCTKVSEGCDHCYAETIAHRFAGTKAYPNGFEVTLRPERLDQPLRWKRPRKVFVNSMSDLFHKDVPVEFIARVFAVMALASRHTFQVLTKRPGRMRLLLSSRAFEDWVEAFVREEYADQWAPNGYEYQWPLPNVWLGTSVESQKWADVRVPQLLNTPAAVRFLSCEPLLGPVDLTKWAWCNRDGGDYRGFASSRYCRLWFGHGDACRTAVLPQLDWVIVGGESGPRARPMNPEWARVLRDDCIDADIAFLFKQWGGLHPKAAGRELDGRTWDEYPEVSA